MSPAGFARLVDVAQWAAGAAAGAALVMLFTLEGAPADEATATDVPMGEATGDGVVAFGGAVYADHCASCHGAAGGGGLGPPLASVVEAIPDPADQVVFVATGRGLMPGFADELSAEELEAVVTFTREGFG